MCEGPAALDTVLAGAVAEMEQRGSTGSVHLLTLPLAKRCVPPPSAKGHDQAMASERGGRRSLDSHCARIDSRSCTRCSERSKAMAELREQTGSDRAAIRPFRVNVPEAELTELRRRINATKWPDRETVPDASQGVQLTTIHRLARYWGTEYDWRKIEARLNALPEFITEIDGLDIHFIHVRSEHENALPLIVTHGWPGSIIEQLKIVDPLTNPTAHGASASDAFHLVIPSMPGYGFSGKPTTTGWGPDHIARAWAERMKRLGYDRYVASGGDWGGQISDLMGAQAPAGLLGIHTNFPGAVRADVTAAA